MLNLGAVGASSTRYHRRIAWVEVFSTLISMLVGGICCVFGRQVTTKAPLQDFWNIVQHEQQGQVTARSLSLAEYGRDLENLEDRSDIHFISSTASDGLKILQEVEGNLI